MPKIAPPEAEPIKIDQKIFNKANLKLKTLDEKIPEGTKIVNLSDNKIKDLSLIHFPDSVEIIKLSKNGLEDISKFKAPASLFMLDLSDNRISIPQDLKMSQKVGIVNLKDNFGISEFDHKEMRKLYPNTIFHFD